ncbi:DUF6083 domain-containing protein [Streptomyces sp. AgN23]|uniref:DUF6083 domain-containing protein n=1 Tax=Streptomyces sp. AgN23 TaxID=1188315 RepID=UPI001FF3C724|nr:DUF6083 domain-containing protein [Streptomyces sp. AgN23]
MQPTPATEGRHRDGSPRHRSLRVAPYSPSRLLRAGQGARCRHCGHRLEWFHTSNGQPIALHPAEIPATTVPESCRWHLSCGTAYPSGDGSAWCRIPHTLLCTHHTAPAPLSAPLQAARRQLAVRTRRLQAHTFTPPPSPPATKPRPQPCRPARPVVQILYTRYLAAHPIEELRCVAQTRHRHRCPSPILATTPGTWTLLPTGPTHGQLALPQQLMAVYNLSHLPYAEQMRWRTQRCPAHTAAPAPPTSPSPAGKSLTRSCTTDTSTADCPTPPGNTTPADGRTTRQPPPAIAVRQDLTTRPPQAPHPQCTSPAPPRHPGPPSC